MSSPFAVLRRNQKILLAVFGVIIMVVFVVGSAFDDFFRKHHEDRRDQPVVRWKYGTLGQMDLERMKHRNEVVSKFMIEVLQRTQERKGVPKVRPLVAARNEQDLVRRMLLAQKAKDLGIVISDDAVKHYLNQLCDAKLSSRDFSEIISAIPNRRIGEPQILEEMRMQLAAENAAEMLIGRGYHTLTPSAAWEMFNRVHHRVKAEVLPVDVDDYKGEVADPTAKELEKFYDEHKDSYPHPDYPEPGFRQRPRAAFEYLKIEFAKFVEVEKAKLTEDELREEYDKRVARGEYKIAELPSLPKDPTDKPDEPGDESTDKPGDESTDKPGDKPVDKPADKPGDKPTDKPEDKPADQPEDKPADKPNDKPEDKSEKSDTKPSESPCQDDPPPNAKDDKPAALKTKPSKEAKQELNKPTNKTDDESDDKPGDKPEDKPGDKPEDKPGDKPDDQPTEEPKPKVRSFEEVREDIAKSLAAPKAQKAFERTKTTVRKELDTFAREYRAYAVMQDDSATSRANSPKLDIKSIADRFDLVAGETPLVDALSVLEYELGQGTTIDWSGGLRMIRFSEFAFREGIPLYSIGEVPGQDPDVTFLYWKTAEEPARTPSLDEIRGEVVDAWKHRQAVPIAKAAAEKLVQESRNKDTLKEAFGDKVLETNEFSWMTSGAIAFGAGMPSISRVENVDTPGFEFMEAVFALGVGDVGVAVNHPQSKVYVVRVDSEVFSEDVRRTRFMLMGSSTEVRQLAQFEGQRAIIDWFTQLQNEMKVEWVPRTGTVAMSDE